MSVAQEPALKRWSGVWEGELQAGPRTLSMVFSIAAYEDATLGVTFDSPKEGLFGFDAADVSVEGDNLIAKFPILQAELRGTIQADGKSIASTWKQRGAEIPFTLQPAEKDKLPPPPAIAEELKGLWEGEMPLPGGATLRMVLRVEPSRGDPDRLAGYLDSPDQGARGIPVSSATVKDGKVAFSVKLVAGEFEGTVEGEGKSLKGTWSQAGSKFPLELKRTEKPSVRNRPQEPKPPFPYQAESVRIENDEAENVTLAGTLTLPEGSGPFPAVVLVSGSGPQDRDETLLGHKPFLVLADFLTRQGVAVLRYDDRGHGESIGKFAEATTDDFVGDALAAVRFLKQDSRVHADRIGIIGHSEGGIVAPIAAARAPEDVAFIVMMAGLGVPGSEIVLRQQELIARASGAPEPQIEATRKLSAEIFSMLNSGASEDELTSRIEAMIAELKESMSEEDLQAMEGLDSASTGQSVKQLLTPWFRYFLKRDPRPDLSQVRCPVLALNGEKDLQVDPRQNLPEIEKALKAGGNSKFKIVEFPGLNHLFQPAKTGVPAEYGAIETTIDPVVLDTIGGWIAKVVR